MDARFRPCHVFVPADRQRESKWRHAGQGVNLRCLHSFSPLGVRLGSFLPPELSMAELSPNVKDFLRT